MRISAASSAVVSSCFREMIVRNGKLETLEAPAGLAANAPPAADVGGVLVPDASGLAAGFGSQPDTTATVRAVAKNSRKFLKRFTFDSPDIQPGNPEAGCA